MVLYYILYSSSNFQITYVFSLSRALHNHWFVIIELDKWVSTLSVAIHVGFFHHFLYYGSIFILRKHQE